MKQIPVVEIRFLVGDALYGVARFKKMADRVIYTSIESVAKEALEDCQPYIPVLTGRLRDSGHTEGNALLDYTVKLVWDVMNPKNQFPYAPIQYDRVLNHVDGRYAAKWVENSLKINRGKYQARFWFHFKLNLNTIFQEGGV